MAYGSRCGGKRRQARQLKAEPDALLQPCLLFHLLPADTRSLSRCAVRASLQTWAPLPPTWRRTTRPTRSSSMPRPAMSRQRTTWTGCSRVSTSSPPTRSSTQVWGLASDHPPLQVAVSWSLCALLLCCDAVHGVPRSNGRVCSAAADAVIDGRPIKAHVAGRVCWCCRLTADCAELHVLHETDRFVRVSLMPVQCLPP